MKPTRVIQWATGPVGSVQLAEVIDNPDFDLVGLFVYSPDKVGADAGALVGALIPASSRPTTGRRFWLLMPTSCCIRQARPTVSIPTPTTSSRCLKPARALITVTSYAHLPTLGSDVRRKDPQSLRRGALAVLPGRRAPRIHAGEAGCQPDRAEPTRRHHHHSAVCRLLARARRANACRSDGHG